MHRTGTVSSGDVTLFYRHFGKPGGTPILIFHGANYYDSYDWIGVASALSHDREVVAWDARGFGESGWSPSKDYSYDAHMGDVTALLRHLGWGKAVVMGHSLGGSYALILAARFPSRAAGLVLVDHCPSAAGRRGGGTTPSVNNKAEVFPTLEVALAVTSRDRNMPEGSPQRARLEAMLKPVESGFVFRRDPDFSNRVPLGSAGWTPRIVVADTWLELAKVRCAVLIVRGTRSDRYTPEALARVAAEFPDIELVHVDSGHDVAAAAPGQLVDGVKRFLAERVDGEKLAIR